MRRWILALAAAALAAGAAAPAATAADTLRAGVGRADLTPPTGYYMMGWVRSDAKLEGQHTRLFSRAIVLERDGRKVALVALDLGAIPGGMLAEAAQRAGRGFSERNVLASASHTHAAPTGFYNFSAYNTVFMTTSTPADQNVEGALDPQLYAFMVRQVAQAIRRADDDLAPAAAGWGATRIETLTKNRSIEAHLHNHGIVRALGEGRPEQDPAGRLHTIDPEVHVLRVDQRRGRKRIPVGMWSTFANHGTVNPHTYRFYNADHHGSATRVAEAAIRRAGRVPRGQDVVNAYGNTDEGDMSAGLDRRGPAWADEVGRREASAMLRAWRAAGRRLSTRPALDARWTRVCFCGQAVEGGAVDDTAVVGLPLFTGSEEGRGPLYDQTGVPFEDRRSPVPHPHQGHKVQVAEQGEDSVPKAVPLLALRLGDRIVASVPGEMTAGMGERVRAAVLGAARPAGVRAAVISGLANEYLQYFVTPEEYDRQHYEGGSQLYGRVAANLLKGTLADLAGRLATGRPAPEPYAFDPRNGVGADAAPFDAGAAGGQVAEQAARTVVRLDRAAFAWRGAPRGLDRPLDRAFVRVERRAGRRWVGVTDDLGLQVRWRVDGEGLHRAEWEVPLTARRATYRFVVTAARYRLAGAPFRVVARPLRAVVGGGRVRLAYPAAIPERDFTYRPPSASRLAVRFRVGPGRYTTRRGRGSVAIPRGADVIPSRGARDAHGNANGPAIDLK
jgi:neutral ceramidase